MVYNKRKNVLAIGITFLTLFVLCGGFINYSLVENVKRLGLTATPIQN